MSSATTEILIGKEIVVHGCRIGERIDENDPLKDVHLDLVIDEVTAETNPKYGNVILWIKKAHIAERPIAYCVECLKEGKRNRDCVCWAGGGKRDAWCDTHYNAKMRAEYPELRCPMCEEGYMMSSMGDNVCSVCGYREPHVHDQPKMYPLSSGGDMKPIQIGDMESTNEPLTVSFACTCMGWNTPEEHKAMREKIAEEKEKFIKSAKEGMIFCD